MAAHMGENVPTRLLRYFFYLLYHPFAWSYDLVAWIVSLGQWKQWIRTTLPYTIGSRVLELGHGPGHLQLELAGQCVSTVGIDRSPQMGLLAKRKLSRAMLDPQLVRADGRRLPFATASFDHVVATFPTQYITEASTLSEARRLLRSHGTLVLLPAAWITGRGLPSRAAAWLFRATGQAGEWTWKSSDIFRRAGYTVEEVRVALPGSEVMLLVCKSQ